MIGSKYDLCIRVSDKEYHGNKPVFSKLPNEVVKSQMLALKCYGCLMYILRAIGEKELSDEVRELLVIAFANSHLSDIKQMFYSNPVKPFKDVEHEAKDIHKLHSKYSALLRSGANRLTMLCGENWYKHISSSLVDIENFKLNCVSSIFNPYSSNGSISNIEQLESLWGILSHIVTTLVTLEYDCKKCGKPLTIPDNTEVGELCFNLRLHCICNENCFTGYRQDSQVNNF